MINKQTARVRRAKRSRAKMRELGVYRLSVHRTPRHIYAQLVAERARAAGVSQVAFDRAGFRYHGRVKALADGAREGGLEF